MSFKVIDIRTKAPTFDSWVEEIKANNNLADLESAILFWTTPKETNWAKLNCEIPEIEYIYQCLGDALFDIKVRDFLRKHISEFIEYVEE